MEFALKINSTCFLAIVAALLSGWSIGPVARADDPPGISLQSDPDFADV
jgi:hypothetical protein